MARINLVESGVKCKADAAVERGGDVEVDGKLDRNTSDRFLTRTGRSRIGSIFLSAYTRVEQTKSVWLGKSHNSISDLVYKAKQFSLVCIRNCQPRPIVGYRTRHKCALDLQPHFQELVPTPRR